MTRSTSSLPATITRWDARLFAVGTAHRLACVRTALAVVIGFRLAPHQWWTLGDRPEALFDPVPIVSLFPSVPSAGWLIAIEAVGLAAVVAVVVQWRPVMMLRIAWLALLLLGAFHGSAGKVMHNEVLLLLATVPLLFSASDARIGDRSESLRWGWPPRAALAVLATVYFLTGVQKLRHSGISWVVGDNMTWVLYAGAASPRTPFPELTTTVAGMHWLTHLMAAGALLLEISAPLLVIWPVTRAMFVLGVCSMHASIGLFMGLDYSGWVLTVLAVTLPWNLVGRGAPGLRPLALYPRGKGVYRDP